MSYSLKDLEDPRQKEMLAMIFGEAGVGKTLLSALFPKPIILAAEDGSETVAGSGAKVLKVNSSADLIEAVKFACTQGDMFETIVVDTITKIGNVVDLETIASCPKGKKGMGQVHGGYFNGRNISKTRHDEIMEVLLQAREHYGKHIVLLAHAGYEHVAEPDKDAFDKFTIAMQEKSADVYIHACNFIGHLRIKTSTITKEGSDRSIAKSSGLRELNCVAKASSITKNRYFIDKVLAVKLGENPLYDVIPTLNKGNK